MSQLTPHQINERFMGETERMCRKIGRCCCYCKNRVQFGDMFRRSGRLYVHDYCLRAIDSDLVHEAYVKSRNAREGR